MMIIVGSCFLNYLPHLESPYLFHVDEWYHIAEAKLVAKGSSIDWYYGNPFMFSMERAWHFSLSIIYSVFNLNVYQWSVLPSIFHGMAIVSVYLFVSKLYDKKHALITSLLVGLMASNVTMGGPVFLIPVNIGFIFIPLALLFGFNLINLKNRYYNFIVLFAIVTFTLYAHPPTAVVMLIILSLYSLFKLLSEDSDSKQNGVFLLFTLFCSVIVSIPNYLQQIQELGLASIDHNFLVFLKAVPFIYGLIPSFFFIVGFYIKSKSKEKETWTLLLTCLILLFNIFIYSILNINYVLPYQRTFLPLFLLMSIIASVGFLKILDYNRYFKKYTFPLLILMLLLTSIFAVKNNIETDYYQLIDDQDYDSFLWIRENTADDIIVLSDPWKARALAPVAERIVYAVMPFGPVEEKMKLVYNANDFFADNCSNTSFLIKNDIDIVYTRGNCNNSLLIEVYDNTYRFIRQ